MRKYGRQWKDLNRAEVESLIRTGLSLNEVQQLAIFGAFLYSVPYNAKGLVTVNSGKLNDSIFIHFLASSGRITVFFKTVFYSLVWIIPK